MRTVRVIDSHTGGEPTRVVVEGAPDLGDGSMAERLERFRDAHDDFRSAVVNEPRGSDVMVGALLLAPTDPACAAGVIFFNNVGYLGMCGHGSIGVVTTLAHMGRIGVGKQRIETPVGIVTVELNADRSVTVENVLSYRSMKQITIDVEGHGPMRGDVAWGGNWFFLTEGHGQELTLRNAERLTELCWRIRHALERAGITGSDGHEIDHVELTGPPVQPGANARNFVLCPGGAFRSFSLRHRDVGKTGMSGVRWQAARGRDLAAGEHRRQRLRRALSHGGRLHSALHHRPRVRERRSDAAVRSSRPVLHGDSRMNSA